MQTVFTGLDHHQKEAVFATCGQQVDIWDEQRTSPIRSFTWGVDSFNSVHFNPVEVRAHVSIMLKHSLSSHKLKRTLTTAVCLDLHQSFLARLV